MKPILTVTMNPALDIATETERLVPQKKLRCSEPRYEPGGGGINVARLIRELGGESTAFVMAGGANGERLRAMVADAGLDVRSFEADGDTRFSLNVVERASAKHFRFVLPGERQRPEKADAALAELARLIEAERHVYVVISGSLPAGLPQDFFARLARLARERQARVVLDTSGPALAAALEQGGFLVRTNSDEAKELSGRKDQDAALLARALLEQEAAEVVIIALGAEGALVATGEGEVRIASPNVEVVSAVGAGDCFVGALTFALANDRPLIEACRLAVAAAAAAVTTPASELAHKADVDALYPKARVVDDASGRAGRAS